MNDTMTTTAFSIDGFKTVKTLGVVRGIVVRSRSIVGTIGAGIQSLFGGNITLWTEMCEHARQEAFDLMARHAEQMGAKQAATRRRNAAARWLMACLPAGSISPKVWLRPSGRKMGS